jgi:hypothetical protein
MSRESERKERKVFGITNHPSVTIAARKTASSYQASLNPTRCNNRPTPVATPKGTTSIAPADEYAVHVCGMNPVEMNGMGFGSAILEADDQAVANRGPGRAGHEAVVEPGRKSDSFGHLEFLILRDHRVSPLARAVGALRHTSVVEEAIS